MMFVKKRKYLYIYDVFLCLTFFLSQEPWERPLVWSTRRLRLCGEFKYIVHKHIQQAANGTGLAADQAGCDCERWCDQNVEQSKTTTT